MNKLWESVDRSRAIQAAVDEKLDGIERKSLAQECVRLDPSEEQFLAEGSLADELSGSPSTENTAFVCALGVPWASLALLDFRTRITDS